MQLEYFQLIDRILDLNIAEKTITVEAQVPQHNTIFEGHFPGYPIMPGVLLIESMAQTSGWLLLALMVVGLWLAKNIADLRKTQDCVLMGRRDCVRISVPQI